MQLSKLARDLWPYLQPQIEKNARGVASSASPGDSGGEVTTLAALSDVSLSGLANLNMLQYNAGSGKWVNITPGVAELDVDAVLDLVDTTRGLSVVSGKFGINLAANSGMSLSGGLALADGIAGPGLNISASKELSVNVSNGLEIVSDDVRVAQNYNFTWTGTHQFNQDPQINANLDFIGLSTRSITAGSHLDLAPSGELWFKPGTNLAFFPNATTARSQTYTPLPTGISGWAIFDKGGNQSQLDINTVNVDELRAKVFIVDAIRVELGSEMWGKSRGIVAANFVVPNLEALVGIWFEELRELPGFDLFEVNDWVQVRAIDLESVAPIQSIWFQVYAKIADSMIDGMPVQSWNLRRKSGGVAGTTIKRGVVVLDVGKIGDGVVDLSALKVNKGPFIRTAIFSSVVDNVPQFTPLTQMGNLKGTVDYVTDTPGFATGSNLGWTPAGGFSGAAIDATDGMRLFNVRSRMYQGGTLAVELGPIEGMLLLQDSAEGANKPRTITWHDDIGTPTTGNRASSIMSWGTSANRQLSMKSYGTVAATFLGAFASGGETAGIATKANWYPGNPGGLIEAQARYMHLSHINGPRLRVGGDLGSFPVSGIHLYNNDSGSGSNTGVTIEQDGIGDAVLHWYLSGGQYYSAGIDNDDGDKFKITAANALGTAEFLIFDPATGFVTINGLTAGSVATGLSAGFGIALVGSQISVNSQVAASAITITGTNGITGGGPLTGSQVLALDSSVARNTWNVGAGNGLSGGGNLNAAGISFAVGQGNGILVNPNNVQVRAGLGLGFEGSGALQVGEGDGIDVLTSTIAVDVSDFIDTARGLYEPTTNDIGVNLGNGMVFSSGAVALGTPGSLSWSSINQTQTNSHIHAIETSSDVGTTPIASILRSTGAGGLTLGQLAVRGNVEILNGGQLYVAGGFGGASGIITTLGTTPQTARVGIGRDPDPQFRLDVNGPLRADYLIGKHAIQLSGVLLLAHFDGGQPFASNFTAETNGHMGQIGTTTGGALFRPGLWGNKGLQVGAAESNSCTNPSFEVNTNDWVVLSGTYSRITTDAYVGGACLQRVASSASDAIRYTMTGLTPGNNWFVSVWIKQVTPGAQGKMFVSDSSGGNRIDGTPVSEGSGWTRVVVNYTVPANGQLRVMLTGDPGTTYFDAVQINRYYLTSYLDGSMGTGHSWSGTPHASSSARTAGYLSYAAANNIRWDRGTIMAWVYLDGAVVPGTNQWLFQHFPASANRIFIWKSSGTGGTWQATIGGSTETMNSSVTGTYQGWQHVAVTWDGATCRMYINGGHPDGGPNASRSYTGLTAVGGTMFIGNNNSGSGPLNGMVEDFVIVDRALPDEEILAVYESDAPVFAESSVFGWMATPTGLVRADENGLWMRDVNGDAVMGFYGGEASTFSWGGRTLEKGDILFGRYGASNGGWMFFDRDGVSNNPFLSLGYGDKTVFAFDSGGATLDGVLDISSTGGIYQGTGSFASPTTGLKLWNSGGVGKLAGYNGGVEQAAFDTDGKLKAGGGNVALDANGLSLVADESGVFIPAQKSIRWSRSSNIIAGAGAQYDNAFNANILNLNARSEVSGRQAWVWLGARAFGASSNAAEIILNSVGIIQMTGGTMIQQPNASAAAPTLYLMQNDLSEEFIEFNGTVNNANPIRTATGVAFTATHYVRVSINGTMRYMPVGTLA